jgi:hypothetical protein
MRYHRLVPTPAAAGVCLATLGVTVADASAPAATPKPPAGYRVVVSPQLPSPNGSDSRGSVSCPTGTVPLGGGVIAQSPSDLANVASSFPSGRKWFGDVKNASGAATTFQVEAICAKRPKGYSVVRGPNTTNPSGSQTRAVATCPNGALPLGGGGISIDFNVFVNTHSTGPNGRTWAIKQNNAGPNTNSLNAVAVCGKMNGYRVVKGVPFTIPAAGQKGASAVCTGRSVPMSGGVRSPSTSVAVNIGGMIPSGDRWDSFVTNNTGFPQTATPIVVCAMR